MSKRRCLYCAKPAKVFDQVETFYDEKVTVVSRAFCSEDHKKKWHALDKGPDHLSQLLQIRRF